MSHSKMYLGYTTIKTLVLQKGLKHMCLGVTRKGSGFTLNLFKTVLKKVSILN